MANNSRRVIAVGFILAAAYAHQLPEPRTPQGPTPTGETLDEEMQGYFPCKTDLMSRRSRSHRTRAHRAH